MTSIGMIACLLMIFSLTTTWAWTSAERRKERVVEEDIDDEYYENLVKKYLMNEFDKELRRNDGTIPRKMIKTLSSSEINDNSRSNEDNEDDYENIIIRRYLNNKAKHGSRRNNVETAKKSRRSLRGNEEKTGGIPFSARRLEKMLEKAIMKIITGDLSTADMLLLKSLNYSLEEVLAIRERELGKKVKEEVESNEERSGPTVDKNTKILGGGKIDREFMEAGQSLTESSRSYYLEGDDNVKMVDSGTKNSATVSATIKKKKSKKAEEEEDAFDFDAYNRQAVYDYENAPNKMSIQQSELEPISSVLDYEDHGKIEKEIVESNIDDDLHTNFDRAMEPHVVFKIRYDDSEFDSNSDEKAKRLSKERAEAINRKSQKIMWKNENELRNDKSMKEKSSKSANLSSSAGSSSVIDATVRNLDNIKPFQSSSLDISSPLPIVYRLGNFITPHDNSRVETTTIRENGLTVEEIGEKSEDIDSKINEDVSVKNSSESIESSEKKTSSLHQEADKLENENVEVDLLVKNDSSDDNKKISMYEGLEWVEDDVYRVIPEAIDSLNYDSNLNYLENETIEDTYDGNQTRTVGLNVLINEDDRNDTMGYQNENPSEEIQSQNFGTNDNSSTKNPPLANLSTYQQLALAHRRDRGQKAIEDIKLKVLAMTGRFNLSSSSNQVQRERLTMFSPSCQPLRNTDPEAWSDPFSMNMYFQLNLTSGDHVVAAKLRIYKLPQDNATSATTGAIDDEDEEEKKIRISVYFYTKSLKKHRSKKRLMDSVVASLTPQGSHLALDVRQALRFWRQNLPSSHGASNNHGLVIQVEDQDGRPLKPAQYIQQDSCHTASERNEDDKAYQRIPALFVQACSRYVRVVNGQAVTYVNCSKSSRNGRH